MWCDVVLAGASIEVSILCLNIWLLAVGFPLCALFVLAVLFLGGFLSFFFIHAWGGFVFVVFFGRGVCGPYGLVRILVVWLVGLSGLSLGLVWLVRSFIG